MPILKCEASKATPAEGIAYIMDEEKKIAGGSQGFLTEDPDKMAMQMMQTIKLFRKDGYNARKYYHAKLSFSPQDRPENGGVLTAKLANEYAEEYANTLWPDREVVWSVQDHGTSIHIHFIIAACAQSSGKKLDARDAEYRKWKDYANELAAEFGFSTLDWRKAVKEKREREVYREDAVHLTFAELEMRKKNKAVWKDELRSIIDSAAAESCSMQAFRSALEKNGVILTRCTEQVISYKLRDHKACRGDTLGGDYTLQAIQNALHHNALHSEPVLFDEIDFEARKKYRSWGRLAGMKREEVDELCDTLPYASWQEKQVLWDYYKKARDAFWEDYQKRKDRLQEQLDEAYRLRRKAKNAEWLVDPRNRQSSIGSIIFAGIYLHRFGGSEQFDACIDNLKSLQELLRREAQKFKAYSCQAADVLKTGNLPLETYTDSLLLMQEMAEDICLVGPSAVEYWAEQYQLRMPSMKSLEEVLKDSRKRSRQEEKTQEPYQIKPVDWHKF